MPLSCSDCCHMPTVKNRRGAKVLKYQLCFCLFVWFRCRHLTRWFKAPFTPNFYTQSLSQVIENQHEDLDQGWTGLSSFPNPDRSLPIKCLVLYRHTDPKTPENPIKTDYFSLLKTKTAKDGFVRCQFDDQNKPVEMFMSACPVCPFSSVQPAHREESAG